MHYWCWKRSTSDGGSYPEKISNDGKMLGMEYVFEILGNEAPAVTDKKWTVRLSLALGTVIFCESPLIALLRLFESSPLLLLLSPLVLLICRWRPWAETPVFRGFMAGAWSGRQIAACRSNLFGDNWTADNLRDDLPLDDGGARVSSCSRTHPASVSLSSANLHGSHLKSCFLHVFCVGGQTLSNTLCAERSISLSVSPQPFSWCS